MIQSMTAFARNQTQGAWGTLICELRSINHRYLELAVRLPENFSEFEMLIRDQLREHIKRGKVDCQLRYQPNHGSNLTLNINQSLMMELATAMKNVSQHIHNPAPISPLDVLYWPGVLHTADDHHEDMKELVLTLIQKTAQDFIAARAREGEELKQLFLQRLEGMKTEIAKVRQRLPDILIEQRERLVKRFSDAKLELDPGRLEQEMVLFAQKIDVAEELDRLDAHISEVRHVLKQGGLVGRRLDFLMQELNREANTLGAKSAHLDTTRACVELKVLIEQIREQVQNLE